MAKGSTEQWRNVLKVTQLTWSDSRTCPVTTTPGYLSKKRSSLSTSYTERMSNSLRGEMKNPLGKGNLQYTTSGLEFYFIRKLWCPSKSGPKDSTWNWYHSFTIWWRKALVTNFLRGEKKERRKMRICHLVGGRGSLPVGKHAPFQVFQGEEPGIQWTLWFCSGPPGSVLCSSSS